jgi:hypothetical protein
MFPSRVEQSFGTAELRFVCFGAIAMYTGLAAVHDNGSPYDAATRVFVANSRIVANGLDIGSNK